jgi:GNAT superfamily N-acetyltransferase
MIDPLLMFLLSSSSFDNGRRVRFMRAEIKFCLRFGEVHTTPTLEGVALWISPHHPKITRLDLFRSGLTTLKWRMGPHARRRYTETVRFIRALQREAAPGPHWYLSVVGVDPEHKGKGIGGRLLQPILKRADAEGLPCYLETGNPFTLPFYQRLGFTVVSEGQLPDDTSLKVYGMRRDPT